jgi:molybdenum cofactor cytidylyltransferase
LKETSGAKKVINNNLNEVFAIPFPPGDIDIDTPKDYKQLLSISARGESSIDGSSGWT